MRPNCALTQQGDDFLPSSIIPDVYVANARPIYSLQITHKPSCPSADFHHFDMHIQVGSRLFLLKLLSCSLADFISDRDLDRFPVPDDVIRRSKIYTSRAAEHNSFSGRIRKLDFIRRNTDVDRW